MKPVFLVGGAEVAVLLAQGLEKGNTTAVFVANGLDETHLKQYGRCISLDMLAQQLKQSPNSAVLILSGEIEPLLLKHWADIAQQQAITFLPSYASWQRLWQSRYLMQYFSCGANEYLAAEDVVSKAQYLPYPLLLQGPLLDANNFYQIVRKPKQLVWALDNAKALSIKSLRLSCYREVKTRFLLQASYQHGQLHTPSVVGVNNEHGVLHEAWQGDAIPDHWLINATSLLAKLAFLIAHEGVISAYFDVVNDEVKLQSFAPWPVLAGWVNHKSPDNVFAQQRRLLLQQPLLNNGQITDINASALKLQKINGQLEPQVFPQFDFGDRVLFFKQADDVREAVRQVIIVANNAC